MTVTMAAIDIEYASREVCRKLLAIHEATAIRTQFNHECCSAGLTVTVNDDHHPPVMAVEAMAVAARYGLILFHRRPMLGPLRSAGHDEEATSINDNILCRGYIYSHEVAIGALN